MGHRYIQWRRVRNIYSVPQDFALGREGTEVAEGLKFGGGGSTSNVVGMVTIELTNLPKTGGGRQCPHPPSDAPEESLGPCTFPILTAMAMGSKHLRKH